MVPPRLCSALPAPVPLMRPVMEACERGRERPSSPVLEPSTPWTQPEGRGSSPSEAVCSAAPPACRLGGSLCLPPCVRGGSAQVGLLSFRRRLSGRGQESGRAVMEPTAWLTAFQTREAGRAARRFHGRSGFPDLSPPDGVLGSMENMPCHAYRSLEAPSS